MTFANEQLDVYRPMRARLGRRGSAIHEEPATYGAPEIDADTDSDTDPEGGSTGFPGSIAFPPAHRYRARHAPVAQAD